MALFGRVDRELSKHIRRRVGLVLACWITCAVAVVLIPRPVKKAASVNHMNEWPTVQLHNTATGIEFAIPSASSKDVTYELRKGEIAITIRGRERVYSIGASLDTTRTRVEVSGDSVLIQIPNSKTQQQKEN